MDETKEIHEVPLKDIRVSKLNVRHTNLEAGIKELMESINKYGLLQPVVLKGKFGEPPYDLIVGQRRYLAHERLGMKDICAIFRSDFDDTHAKILSLTENMLRVDLNRADKAEAINALYKEYNRDIKIVAQELGLSIPTIREYIDIDEQATPKAKDMLRQNKINKTDIKRVIDAAQGDVDKADELIDEMSKLTKYEKDRAVDYGKTHQKASADEIIKESMKPKQEPTVILNLTIEVDEALNKAVEDLSMDRESVVSKALSEWLKNNGFL